jgi:RNA polymerase subunit RPABC4/transcription elongation factor Spt4
MWHLHPYSLPLSSKYDFHCPTPQVYTRFTTEIWALRIFRGWISHNHCTLTLVNIKYMACHGTMEYNLVDVKDYTKDCKVVVNGHTDHCNAMANNHICVHWTYVVFIVKKQKQNIGPNYICGSWRRWIEWEIQYQHYVTQSYIWRFQVYNIGSNVMLAPDNVWVLGYKPNMSQPSLAPLY